MYTFGSINTSSPCMRPDCTRGKYNRLNAAGAIALAPQFKQQVNPLYLSMYYYSTK